MKKPLAITLLSVGNCLLTLALGFAGVFLFLTGSIGLLLDIVLIAGQIVGFAFIQRLFERRYSLSPLIFWLLSSIPAAVVSSIAFGIVIILDSIDYFSGFFAGLAEFLFTLSSLVYSAVFLILFGVVLLIKTLIKRKNEGKISENNGEEIK